jgi:hypothetical protein
VPDSAFFYSTQIQEMVANTALNPQHLSIGAIDSLLRLAALSGIATPQTVMLADNISCRIRLRAQMRSSISLDVTMLLRVRYSDKFNSPDVNKNPSIAWMGIIAVPTVDFKGADSLLTSGYTLRYLYDPAHPDSVRDTVTIDSGYTYLVAADSGAGQREIYHYLTLKDNSIGVDTESFNYSWFYTNLDYNGGMVMDSLIMFGGGGSRSMRTLLPPVDTAMHRFVLYVAVRDRRSQDPNATPGEAFESAGGYLSYTPAYARNAARRSRGILGAN